MEEGETAVWMCGGLKEMDNKWSGYILNCGLVRVCVVLLEKYVTVKMDFEISYMLEPHLMSQFTF